MSILFYRVRAITDRQEFNQGKNKSAILRAISASRLISEEYLLQMCRSLADAAWRYFLFTARVGSTKVMFSVCLFTGGWIPRSLVGGPFPVSVPRFFPEGRGYPTQVLGQMYPLSLPSLPSPTPVKSWVRDTPHLPSFLSSPSSQNQ